MGIEYIGLDFSQLLIVILVIPYIPFVIKKIHRKESIKTIILNLGFYIYILELIGLVFLPLPFHIFHKNYLRSINIIPIKQYIVILKYGGIHILIRNLVGNIVLFMPLGFFVPNLSKKLISIKSVLIISLIFSISIETIQFIINAIIQYPIHSVYVDDVLENIIGALLGFIFYRILNHMLVLNDTVQG